MIVVTPKQMKYLENKANENGNSFEILMENAGKKLSERILEIVKSKDKKSILFLCGNGNNAGDCFVAARYLLDNDIDITIAMLCGSPKTDISMLNFKKISNEKIIFDKELLKLKLNDKCFDLIVDGVFGTGFHGIIPDDICEIFDACKNIEVIAVDVPSGGNCMTGTVSAHTLAANETITFGFEKFGMTQYPLRNLCGKIIIEDIGISKSYAGDFDYIIKKTDSITAANIIPLKKPESHKGTFGRLLVICGSESMPGACIMACEAAAKGGVGLLEVASVKPILPIIAAKVPEAMHCALEPDEEGYIAFENYSKIIEHSKKASAVVIGCGIGVTENTKKLVKKLVCDIDCPIILDADGINCIADSIDIIKQNRSGIVLTPHPAEMGRLCRKTAEEVQQNRLETALNFSKECNGVVLLKGAGTIIAKSDKVYVNPNGNPGMGKGGSGDVLSGIIGSLAAQGIDIFYSTVLGAYVHGLAGDIAAEKLSMQSMTATDIIKNLSEAFKMILE